MREPSDRVEARRWHPVVVLGWLTLPIGVIWLLVSVL